MDIEKILARTVGFEWDSANINKIWEKHRVAPNEAEAIFFNKPLLLLPDEEHSAIEQRFTATGKTDTGRRLFVTWTLRTRIFYANEI